MPFRPSSTPSCRPIGACGRDQQPGEAGQRAGEQRTRAARRARSGRPAARPRRGSSPTARIDRARAGQRQHPLDRHAGRQPEREHLSARTGDASRRRRARACPASRAGPAARTPAARTAGRAARASAAPAASAAATQPSTSPARRPRPSAERAHRGDVDGDRQRRARRHGQHDATRPRRRASAAIGGVARSTASTATNTAPIDDVAVREREHAREAVDEREAERDQPVRGAGRQTGRPAPGPRPAPLTSGDRVPDPQLAVAQRGHLDVTVYLPWTWPRPRSAASASVVSSLKPRRPAPRWRSSRIATQIVDGAVDDRVEALGLAERPFGHVHVRAGGEGQLRGRACASARRCSAGGQARADPPPPQPATRTATAAVSDTGRTKMSA